MTSNPSSVFVAVVSLVRRPSASTPTLSEVTT